MKKQKYIWDNTVWRKGAWAAALCGMASMLYSCGEGAKEDASYYYESEIKRTSYGIPHITAADFGSLGFGEGYAAAEDHVCNIAHGIIISRGERAKYHGVGEKNKHLMSDIVVRAMDIPDRAGQDLALQPPENRDWIAGYAAGYNKYIRKVGRNNITSWCKGAEWVREITEADVFSRFQTLAQSGPRMAGMIVSAQPPAVQNEQKHIAVTADFTSPDEAIAGLKARYMGSNGWAIGRDRSENGRGMLLGNPHYPWTGTNRFWEKHLTIPGKLDVYGVHLVGGVGVAIGFNENIGWTHTVSDSERVVFYTLDLVPSDPTSYYYDGKPRKMTSKLITIPVKGEKGIVSEKQHRVWFSHYGPMVVLPNMPWNEKQALTMRDANFDNQNLMSQWKAMAQARDMDDFKEAHRQWNAMPWVNSMATSRDGRAVYIDGSNVGRLSEEAISVWRERVKNDPLTKSFYHKMGLILLDGSDSRFEWQAHPEARVAGVVPFAEQPQQDRTDYIFNANDSYWLTNVAEPLEGYSPLYGPEKTPRSLRTRMNAKLLSDLSAAGPAGIDGKFSLKEMQAALLENRSLTAELLRDDLITACRGKNTIDMAGRLVDLTAACQILADYDGRFNLDSKGAVLFREWITRYDYGDTFKKGKLFAVGFNPKKPVDTPRSLADTEVALRHLALAIETLDQAGLPLDSTLGDVQFAYRGSEKISIHGGDNAEGIANMIGRRTYDSQAEQVRAKNVNGSKRLTDKGYVVNYGSSFLYSLSYTDNGPKAEAFLTYSQSGDPTSEHYTDQTRLFSRKAWRPILFRTEDIEQDVKSSIIITEQK